jgi:hypothetical protein
MAASFGVMAALSGLRDLGCLERRGCALVQRDFLPVDVGRNCASAIVPVGWLLTSPVGSVRSP